MHIQLAENMGQIEKDDMEAIDGRQQMEFILQQQQSGSLSMTQLAFSLNLLTSLSIDYILL